MKAPLCRNFGPVPGLRLGEAGEIVVRVEARAKLVIRCRERAVAVPETLRASA